MGLKKKQQYALDVLQTGHNVFLSGEAGTGKSYVIECFKEYLSKSKKKYVVCAPTGLAALNVGGVTLHRAFGLSINALDWKASINNVEDADVIIVDEISMCRVDTFRKIAKVLFDWKTENPTRKQKQIVVVGDFFQLPPVLTEQDSKVLKITQEQAYPFCSEEWGWFNFTNIVLNEVVRQEDLEFATALNKIRIGNREGVSWISDNAKKSKTKKAISLCSRNKDAKSINTINLKKIKEVTYTYKAVETGDVRQEDRATDTILELKKGARVMCLVNKGETIANGMLGTVITLGRDSVEVKFDNGENRKFEMHTWSILGFKTKAGKKVVGEVGTFTQIPLKLAYAITIHKSQGQTYEAVNLSPSCFCAGQLYVGLSRCKDVKKMHLLEPIEPSNLIVSGAVKKFYAEIKKDERDVPGSISSVLKQISLENQINLEEMQTNVEYIKMNIPKHFEKEVLSLLKGEGASISSQSEINALQGQIEALKEELEKLKASAGRRPKVDKSVEEEILRLRKTGMGMNKIAKAAKCGDGTVRRVLKDYGMS